MNRIERGIRAATDAALLSEEKYRVGASIYIGNKLISVGWNSKKTHPDNESIFKWHHAETAALIGTSKRDLSKATIYVVRLTRTNRISISKPCEGCQRMLKAAGITRIVYTDRLGIPQRMSL